MKFTRIIESSRNLFITISLVFLFNLTVGSQTKKSEVANPLDFQKVEIAADIPLCRYSLRKCGEAALVAADLAGFGGADNIEYKSETFVFNKNVAIYLFSMTGFEDDSISGERLRVAFLKTRKGYRFVQIGKQFQCGRGSKAGAWTKELCP